MSELIRLQRDFQGYLLSGSPHIEQLITSADSAFIFEQKTTFKTLGRRVGKGALATCPPMYDLHKTVSNQEYAPGM